MAKKNDTTSKPAASVKAPAPSAPTAPIAAAAPAKTATKKPAVPLKRAVKPAAKTKPAAKATKVPTAKAKRVSKPKSKAPAPVLAPIPPLAEPSYTRHDIALRAYFLSEKRVAHGLHGNEHQDWLEAERQLAAEHAAPQLLAKA